MDKHMNYLYDNQNKLEKYFIMNDCFVLHVKQSNLGLIVKVVQDAKNLTVQELAEIKNKTQGNSNPYDSLVRTCVLTADKISYDYAGEFPYKGFENAINNYQAFLCKVCPGYKEELTENTLNKLSDIMDIADEMNL